MIGGNSRAGPGLSGQWAAAGRRKHLQILVLGAALVAPIWAVKYPPLIDYPNHLARTYVISHLGERDFPLNKFYAVDWGPYPYLAMDVMLLGLERVFTPAIAGKLFLSLCVLGLPAALWCFLSRVSPAQQYLAWFGALFAYNIFFLSGFLAYHLSLAISLVLLGCFHTYTENPTRARFCLCLVLATLLYLTHLVGFALSGLALGVYGLVKRWRPWSFVALFATLLPGSLCYLATRLTANVNATVILGNPRQKIAGLSEIMRGYSTTLDLASFLALLISALLMGLRNREFRWNRGWLSATVVLASLYCVFPMVYGTGWDADTRLLLFAALVAFAAPEFGRRGRFLVSVAIVLIALRLGNVTYHFIAEQPRLLSLAQSFEVTPQNSRVLPIVQNNPRERQIEQPYRHFWAYGVIDRQWFSPYLFADVGVQPLRRLDGPYSPAGFASLHMSSLSLSRLRTDYDYVWAYGVPALATDLQSVGDIVFRSGDLTVYKIRSLSDAAPSGGTHRPPAAGRKFVLARTYCTTLRKTTMKQAIRKSAR